MGLFLPQIIRVDFKTQQTLITVTTAIVTEKNRQFGQLIWRHPQRELSIPALPAHWW